MQIGQGHLDMRMAQKLLKTDNVNAVFQQMRGEGVPQGVGGYLFGAAYLTAVFLDDPTDAIGRQPTWFTILGHLAVEKIALGIFRFDVLLQSSGQIPAQGDIAVDLPFLLGYKDRSAVKVDVRQFQVAQFVAAESTAVEHPDNQTVL